MYARLDASIAACTLSGLALVGCLRYAALYVKTLENAVAILAQVASAAWAKVRARVRSAGDGVRAGLGQPATFTRGGAPLRPQIR